MGPSTGAAAGAAGASGGGRRAPDALLRMNFLLQAASATLDAAAGKHARLATHYSHLVVAVGRKAVLRSSVSVKRVICKGCHALALPGRSADTFVCGQRNAKRLGIRCFQCGTARAILMGKNQKTIKKQYKKARKNEKEASSVAQAVVRDILHEIVDSMK